MAILGDVKEYIGVAPTVTGFDNELLADLNGLFSSFELTLGLTGSPTAIDDTTLWPDYGDAQLNNIVKLYVQVKTKLTFDPIANVNISDSLKSVAESLALTIEVMVNEIAAAVP